MQKLGEILSTFAPYKYQLAVLILVFAIIIYFYYFRGESLTDKPKKSKKGKKTKKKPKKEDLEDAEEDEEEEDAGSASRAKRLYQLAHENLANGMGKDEFLTLVRDLGDATTYIQLKQLYTDASQNGKDPASITVADYTKALAA